MSRIFFGIALLGLGLLSGAHWGRRAAFVNPYLRICGLIEAKIYLDEKETREWSRVCRERAAKVDASTPRETILRDARFLMDKLEVSHLEIYHPQEVARLWQGVNKETGIESDFVDGQLVVFRVHDGSSAQRAGLRAGDLILSVQGVPSAPGVARTVGGLMEIQRQGRTFEANVEPEELRVDERPSYLQVNKQTLLLRVPSFRAEFFERGNWERFVQSLPEAPNLIVDLRGNIGGNFAAGLRFLSPFMCEEQEIGFLLRPRSRLNNDEFLPDDLRDEAQLAVLDANEMVRLKTRSASRCLTARVGVLMDSGTASTAEMVAQALKDYLDARLYGVSSAGQLLVGVWYDLPELGPGWRISVPEAVFQTRRGKRLEGSGVRVDRTLYYDLKELMAGRDNWVSAAMADLGREPLREASRKTASP